MEDKCLWLSGYKLMQRWNMHDVGIVEYVMNGLQPYDDAMQPMLPPKVAEWSGLIRELEEEIDDIEKSFPAIQNSDYPDWCILNLDRQVDPDNNLVKIKFPDGSDSEIREEYETKKAQLERLKIKYSKYHFLPSWVGYELSKNKADIKAVINKLLNAAYKRSDINDLEKIKILTDLSDDLVVFQNELPQAVVEVTAKNAFIRHDDYWEIWHQGIKLEPIIHMDGLIYIAHLLNNPNKEINVSDLYETLHPKEGAPMVSSVEISQSIFNGEMSDSYMTTEGLDDTAKKQIKEQINALKESIETAETDLEKRESSDELKRLYKTLDIYGKNPLSRKAPKQKNESVKRHADAVRKTITMAIEKIRKRNPALADYLTDKETIKRDNGYTYKDKLIWSVSL